MQTAAAAMAPSADKLKAMQWKDAIPLEQKALQALLHAEATFRQIEVAFGQQGGGGSGVNSADVTWPASSTLSWTRRRTSTKQRRPRLQQSSIRKM